MQIKSSPLLLALFLITLLLLMNQASSAIVLTTLTTTTINQFSTYKFQFIDTGAWSQTGTVTLTFQSPPYSFVNNTNITNCRETVDSTYILNCYVSASNAISFQWNSTLVTALSASAGDSLTMSITLQNPSYVDNFTIQYAYTLTGGTAYSSGSSTVRGLTADALTSCSVTFSPSYTNSLSTATVQLVPKNAIPSGGSLQLTVVGYTVTDTVKSINSLSSGAMTSSPTFSYSGQTYILTGLFTSAVASGTSLSLNLASMTTPSTTASSIYSITMTTLSSSNYLNQIDTRSCPLTVSDFPLSLSVTFSSTFYVGDNLRPNLTYTTPIALVLSTDTFSLSVGSSSSSFLSITTANTAGSGGYIVGASSALFMSNSSSGVTFPTTAMTDTFAANASIIVVGGLTIRSLINSGAKTVFFQVFRSSNSYASATATITIKPNSLTSASINPLSSTVSATTTYTFTVVVKNPLSIGAGMRITLPSDVSIATGSCTAAVSSTFGGSVSSNVSCTASSTTVIFVTNILKAFFPGNTSLSVSVSNILNPISIKPTGSFLIQTFYNSSELVNPVDDSSTLSGQTITASFSAISLGNFGINRVSKTNMQYTPYTVTYKVTTKFKANGYLTLSFPSFMILSSTTGCSFTVQHNSGTTTPSQTVTPTSAITGNNNIITFNFSNLITSNLQSGQTITIVMNSVRNYYSLKPINAQLTTYANDGFLIEQSTLTDVTLTNTLEDTTLTLTSTTNNRKNGNPTNSTFTFTPQSSMAVNDIISLELQTTNNINTQMYYSSSPSCLVGGTAATCTIDSVNTKLLNIKLTSALTASTSYSISIANIVLSRSFDVPGKIYVKTYQVSGSNSYIISSATIQPSVNTLTNLITTASLSIDDNSGTARSQLNQLQKFTLTMSAYNKFESGDIVVITVPSQYTFLASTVTVSITTDLTTHSGSLCTGSSTLFCSNNNTSGNLLRVVQKVVGNVFKSITSLSVIVNNGTYRSPTSWDTYNSQNFIINTYSSTGQPIDSVQSGTTSNATFYLYCSSLANRCGTCLADGTCTGCYQLGSGNDTTVNYGGYYYLASNGVCVTSCGGNYYNSSNTCVQCTAPCYSCTGSGSVCTSCINTTLNGQGPFYYYNNTCGITCPSGYFQDTGNVCSACSSTCASCSGSNVLCTSCPTGKYYSSRLATCGDSTLCSASYEFADSTTSTLKCSNCSASCSGCSINSTHCTSCATGYIADYNYGSVSPGRCTNVCPTGTVNDTSNLLGGGCRCNTSACATCQTTINTCLTCNSNRYLQNSACVSSCSSGYYISGSACVACVSNCATCSSATCSSCATNYYLYQNSCISACPQFTTSTTENGVIICYSCGTGCLSCIDRNNCGSCTSAMKTQISSTSITCVSSCSSGYYLYNSQCLTSCPAGYTISGTNCQVTSSNNSTTNTNSTTTSTLTTSSTSRIIPFPYTIGLSVLTIATFISKLGLSHTIVAAGLCAFGGLMESLSWITLMIIEGVTPQTANNPGLYVVLIAFLLNLILNIFSTYFFKKYVWPDSKFQTQFKKLKDKTKTGVCVTYTCLITSLLLSHKFVEILFSNLFQSSFFIYKVDAKTKLTPLNYIRYISFLASGLAIVGGGISNYQLQVSSFSSLVFIQSIDLIIVTIFSGIFAFLVTIRKADDYENNIAQKRNDIEQELDHSVPGDGVYHLQEQQKEGNKLSKYRHRSSIMGNDPREQPVSKRNTNKVNPIGQELNFTNAPLGEREDDQNRLDLQLSGPLSKKNRKQNEIDIDQINLVEDSGDNTMPPSKLGGKYDKTKRNKGKNGDINGTQSQRYKKNEIGQDPQRQRIKQNIQNRLTEQQIAKTKIVRDVNTIDTTSLETKDKDKQKEGSQSFIKEQTKNEIKKQKLEIISNANPENFNKIPEKDRAKAGEMRNAMKILNAKKIQIGQYLEYLDIIEEEDEDKNSDDYQNKIMNKNKGKGKKKGGKNMTNKKMQKRDRTARKGLADDLVINIDGHNLYDDDLEPEIPDFHQTPIKGRKLSENNYNPNEQQFDQYSSLKKNQNYSDKMFSKKNGLNDLVLVSLQSGQNYDKSLGEQFKKGNTLQQVDKDQVPPSNLYSTDKVSFDKQGSNNNSIGMGRDRLVPNPLINDDTHIEYLESQGGDQQTIKGELLDFNNDVSPSYFNQPNLRIQNDQFSQAPTKPKMAKKQTGNTKVGVPEDLDDQEIEGYDQFGNQYDNNDFPEGKMQRYQSNQGMLDYDDIIYQKKNNQKVKQLQKIYLQRQNVNRRGDPRKNRKNYSSQSYRKEES